MFWADQVAEVLKRRHLSIEWVDDMKTPSGKVHVGALRGVVIHDLIYKALKNAKVNTKYTYIFDDHDPMDGLPVYLEKEKYEKYLGMPLYHVPSPVSGYDNYAQYYALDFKKVFNAIACNPEILWATDIYRSGKMNEVIKLCLDKADAIRDIYSELYKKEIPQDWFPFQVFCPDCGKVATTKVNAWDGKEISFICNVEGLRWTKGCGYKGRVSPLSPTKDGDIAGKLPWKVEWGAIWQVLGVTVEGGGKDHMSKGGSYDLATLVCKRVLDYTPPYPIDYEHFLSGGRKMSSSKGIGSSAADMLEILPPQLLRFLMVKTKYNQSIDFNPDGDTIPNLFDEYQKAAEAYFSKTDEDLARIFVLSQVMNIKKPPNVRFSTLTQWVQMPNMEQAIKDDRAEEWVPYAKIWIEKFAPESERFNVQKALPEEVQTLSDQQKDYLKLVEERFENCSSEVELHTNLYNWVQETMLTSKEAFAAIYIALLGKTHGPKASSLIRSLDRNFVKKRFQEASEK